MTKPQPAPPQPPALTLRAELEMRKRNKAREAIPLLIELKRGTAESFTSYSFRVNSPLTIDPTFAPVSMRGPSREEALAMAGFGLDARSDTQVIRAFVLEADIEQVARRPEVVGVWADPEILPIADDCRPAVPTGTSTDVAKRLRVDQVWAATGSRGEGVVIGIVDGGVDRGLFPVAGGWSPDPSSPPGSSNVVWNGHGNMCAHDALIACPDAQIYDYAIGRTPGATNAFLSAALQAFQTALTSHRVNNTPQVLSNSWGLYQQASDPFAPRDPRNYTHNLAHPFMRKAVEVMDEGILVAFAAGNCGDGCPSPKCGNDVGPGKSIRGANAHPRVVCVGAVNLRDEWIGNSSQGPATLAPDKPDVCSFSHFEGHTSCDNGTSAACPVVAGVLGLLVATVPGISQDRARAALRVTARRNGSVAWSANFGCGIVDALDAFQLPP